MTLVLVPCSQRTCKPICLLKQADFSSDIKGDHLTSVKRWLAYAQGKYHRLALALEALGITDFYMGADLPK